PAAALENALPQTHMRAVGYLFLLLLALVTLPALNTLSPDVVRSTGMDNKPGITKTTTTNIETVPPALPLSPPVAPSPPDMRLVLEVKSGDSVSKLFKQAGFGPRQVDDILNSTSDKTILSAISPGYQLVFEITPQQALKS